MTPKMILVVDDEKNIASTLALILQQNGYQTATAYEGASALEQCAKIVPDLLLTDVMMPGINGIELAQAVTQKYQDCKVLLFSGQAATLELLENARKQGSDLPLLSKPIHPNDLLQKVAEMLSASKSHQLA